MYEISQKPFFQHEEGKKFGWDVIHHKTCHTCYIHLRIVPYRTSSLMYVDSGLSRNVVQSRWVESVESVKARRIPPAELGRLTGPACREPGR